MMWLIPSFASAFLLGFYDFFKKLSLDRNAVAPVLFLNTVFLTAIFLPFILGSLPAGTPLEGSTDHRRSHQCHAAGHGAAGGVAAVR